MVGVAPPDSLVNRVDLYKWAPVDPAGHFRITGLAPGEYTVYAWDDPAAFLQEMAEFREAFSSRAVTVIIAAGASTTVQLKAIPADEIRKMRARN